MEQMNERTTDIHIPKVIDKEGFLDRSPRFLQLEIGRNFDRCCLSGLSILEMESSD